MLQDNRFSYTGSVRQKMQLMKTQNSFAGLKLLQVVFGARGEMACGERTKGGGKFSAKVGTASRWARKSGNGGASLAGRGQGESGVQSDEKGSAQKAAPKSQV